MFTFVLFIFSGGKWSAGFSAKHSKMFSVPISTILVALAVLAAERLAGCRPMGRLNDCSYLGF